MPPDRRPFMLQQFMCRFMSVDDFADAALFFLILSSLRVEFDFGKLILGTRRDGDGKMRQVLDDHFRKGRNAAHVMSEWD
jgi:hypothetical protein